MTEARAHAALRAFLARSQAEDVRAVLVITGKGARDRDGSRGIIRWRFLDWIDEPALRPLIARVAKAAPHHGGDGAFYVHLKSSAKRRP